MTSSKAETSKSLDDADVEQGTKVITESSKDKSGITLFGINEKHPILLDEDPKVRELTIQALNRMDVNGDGCLDSEEITRGTAWAIKEAITTEQENTRLRANASFFRKMVFGGFLLILCLIVAFAGVTYTLLQNNKEVSVSHGALTAKGSKDPLKIDVSNLVVQLAHPIEPNEVSSTQGTGKMLGCIDPNDMDPLKAKSVALPTTLVSEDGSIHSFQVQDWITEDSTGMIKIVSPSGQHHVITLNDPACKSVVKNGRRLDTRKMNSIKIGQAKNTYIVDFEDGKDEAGFAYLTMLAEAGEIVIKLEFNLFGEALIETTESVAKTITGHETIKAVELNKP